MTKQTASFIVVGDPVVKGRPRFTRSGRVYTPQKTRDAEAHIAAEAKAQCPDVFFTEPVQMICQFFTKTKRRSDLDNFCKLAWDALNGVLVQDDFLIERLTATIHRATPGEEPRSEFQISVL